MAVKRKKGMRVNYLIIFLSGLALLVAGILVYLLIIKGVYGKYKIKEILPTEENLGGLISKKGHKTAILFSEYTQNMLPEGSTWLSDNVDTWETFLGNMNLGYDLISDEDIELGDFFNYTLLILPGAKAISDLEIIQIKKYLEHGGSIFATSGTASYSNEAKWRGWDFFTEVYGLKFTKEIDPKEDKFKIHGKEVVKLVTQLNKNRSKIPNILLTLEEEYSVILKAKDVIGNKTNVVLNIKYSKETNSSKKDHAMPQKPAIVLEE